MTAILSNINEKVKSYLEGEIKNPILKKVVSEELLHSSSLQTIIKEYFSEKVVLDVSKLQNLTNLILKIAPENLKDIITTLGKSFVDLSIDEQLYIILNIDENNVSFFKILYANTIIGNILKHLISSMGLKITNEDDFVKFIKACSLIDNNVSTELIKNYIHLNFADLITSDKILTCILHYKNLIGNAPHFYDEHRKTIGSALKVKVESIKNKIDIMKLDNMDVAYEIYKLGKLIIDIKLKEIPEREDGYLYKNNIYINFSNEQLEYIVKVIHTCIVNKNMSQTQTILAIIYYLNKDLMKKFMELYNNWLQIRINKYSSENILSNEREIWNFNNQYDKFMKIPELEEYRQILNNIKYSVYINEDMQKINIKMPSFNMKMNKVNIKLQTRYLFFWNFVFF